MQDRVPVNPGRVLITPENGSAAYYATMTRADNPTQEGTPLNKASLLKDATAALFGLGADAVPDDVFRSIVSNTVVNLYVWEKSDVTPSYAKLENGLQRAVYKSGYSTRTINIYISDSVEVSANGGVSLVNPEYLTLNFSQIDSYVRGKYFYVDPSTNDEYSGLTEGKIYYVPADAEIYVDNANYQVHYTPTYEVVGVAAKYDVVSYVSSNDPNAYPIDDGFTYVALGQIGAGNARIATGTYTGTGTYGAANPNSLTFDFEPKLIVVNKPTENAAMLLISDATVSVGLGGFYSRQCTVSLDGNTVTWYNTSSAIYQLNESAATYGYIAIG